LRLRITAAAETAIRSGHPWLFGDSIIEQNREGQLGELAVVYDRKDEFLAVGLFDNESHLRVRVLHVGKPQALESAWWSKRLDQALQGRHELVDGATTACRLINGESDAWPGLVLDRFGGTLVLKLYTAAWFPWLDEIIELVTERLRPERVVLRLSRNIQKTAKRDFGKMDGELICGPSLHSPVIFKESGLRFEADVLRGQKTGFFLDQRENRRLVGKLSRGRTVLNAFCFTGGFSLYAARGGARSVTDLDLSPHALAGGSRNFELNRDVAGVADCRRETVQADAFDWLAGNKSRKFNLIILDPPALAKKQSERPGALRAYAKLASLALRHLEPDGILVACSCSAHVPAQEFFETIRLSSSRTRRAFVEMQTTREPVDHRAAIPEAEYLKAIYLEIKN
jgi:23S rRNA (cytosine1962-C5)-methyltransferase